LKQRSAGQVPIENAAVQSPVRAWGFVAALLAFGLQLLQVRRWSARVPVSDEWQTMKLFGRAAKEGVSPTMLWEQHNEHRIVIANSVFFVVRRLGGWVVLAPHIISALMVAATIGVFTSTALRLKFRPTMVALAVATALTPLQWENTIWGFQVQFVALAFGVVVPLCLLATRPVLGRRAVVLSLAAGLWCTGTIGSGLLAWSVFGLVTLCFLKGTNRLGNVSLIGASAITMGVIYLIGWKRPSVPQAEGPADVFAWVVRGLTFPLAGTGGVSQLDNHLLVGGTVGGLIGFAMLFALGLTLHRLWKARSDDLARSRLVLLGGITAWIIPQVLLIGSSRAGLGGVASRYATIFVWLGAASLLAVDALLESLPPPRGVARFALTAVVTLTALQHVSALSNVDADARGWASKANLRTTRTFLNAGAVGNVPSPNPYANERVFGELLRESIEKDWIGQLPDEVLAQLRWNPTTTGSAWAEGAKYPDNAAPKELWASFNGSDTQTGILLSQPFTITSSVVRVLAWGGPATDGNRLELVAYPSAEESPAVAVFNGSQPGNGSAPWSAKTDSLLGKRVQLRAVDGATGYLGWFAIEPPTQPSRLSRMVDRIIGWSPTITLLAVGLGLMLLLGRRSTAIANSGGNLLRSRS
jgi:hypothetical protein